MGQHRLRGCRILIVEDEYLLAHELRVELRDAGAIVLGPVGTLDGAFRITRDEPHVDAALLDLNLGGDLAFPIADLLVERAVPFLFTTGYDASIIPPRFQHIARCEKPVDMTRLAKALGRVIHE